MAPHSALGGRPCHLHREAAISPCHYDFLAHEGSSGPSAGAHVALSQFETWHTPSNYSPRHQGVSGSSLPKGSHTDGGFTTSVLCPFDTQWRSPALGEALWLNCCRPCPAAAPRAGCSGCPRPAAAPAPAGTPTLFHGAAAARAAGPPPAAPADGKARVETTQLVIICCSCPKKRGCQSIVTLEQQPCRLEMHCDLANTVNEGVRASCHRSHVEG